MLLTKTNLKLMLPELNEIQRRSLQEFIAELEREAAYSEQEWFVAQLQKLPLQARLVGNMLPLVFARMSEINAIRPRETKGNV